MRNNKNSNRAEITPLSQSATVNDLPDDVLGHILSFLPIKEAFKTSILSKRWGPLCYSLSVLHFQHNDIQSKNWIALRRLIDNVMFSPRSQHFTLKSFHLNCLHIHDDDDAADSLTFHNWIDEAKRRRLEELHLLYSSMHISLEPTIFCSKTLVVLNLMNSVVSTMLHCSVDLPSLKTLDLTYVEFEYMDDFMKLLSACPILENLKTSYVDATNEVTLGAYYKPLSKLIKANIQLFEVPFRAVYNVKFLTVRRMERSLWDEEISSYFKDFPLFENITELQLYWYGGTQEWNKVVKMLQSCPKLQTLIIKKACKLKARDDWKYPDHVPACVSSHLTTCKIFHYEDIKADFRFAKYILQNASLLQVMKIYSLVSRQCLEDLISCPKISPACKLSLIDMKVSSS